jgi:hypothetical protein
MDLDFGKNLHSTHVSAYRTFVYIYSFHYCSPPLAQNNSRSPPSHLCTSPHHLPRAVLTGSRQAALPLLQPFLHIPPSPSLHSAFRIKTPFCSIKTNICLSALIVLLVGWVVGCWARALHLKTLRSHYTKRQLISSSGGFSAGINCGRTSFNGVSFQNGHWNEYW